MKFAKYLTAFSVFSVVAGATLPANAIDVGSEISFAVDVSGSVDSGEFDLQKDAYVDVFNDPDLYNKFISKNSEGSIAANFIYWSSSNQQVEAVQWSEIDSVSDSQAFATAIDNTNRPFSGGTDPDDAIDFATSTFANNGFDSNRRIIDVSGDGAGFPASDTENARDNALAGEIDTINGLPIGGNQFVEDFYRNSLIGGDNAFSQPSDNFQDFEVALENKVEKEVGEPIPFEAEGTMGLVALGGYLWYRNRKKRNQALSQESN